MVLHRTAISLLRLVVYSRAMDTVITFSAMFNKADNLCDFLLIFLHTKFFPFKVDLFSEGGKAILTE